MNNEDNIQDIKPVTEDNTREAYDDLMTSLVTTKDGDLSGMMLWTDDKKKDYVTLFKQKANVSTYILRNTAKELAKRALDKKFLGQPRFNKLQEACNHFSGTDQVHGHYDSTHWATTYNRSQADMNAVVEERVTALFKSLPSLNKAILILDPEIAKKMEERDLLKERGQEITEKIQETSEPIRMSQMDQTMTIGAFLKHIKDMEVQRKAWFEELQEIGSKGRDLEIIINKALFKGVPGISDEIEDVCRDIYEKSKAMGLLSRRVEEQVLYGDSEAALKLLSHFEKDEGKLREDIAARFNAGLEKLKLKVAKKKKAIAAGEGNGENNAG
jgi:hypothetical protein